MTTREMPQVNDTWEENARPGHTVVVTDLELPDRWQEDSVHYRHVGTHNRRPASYETVSSLENFWKRYTLKARGRSVEVDKVFKIVESLRGVTLTEAEARDLHAMVASRTRGVAQSAGQNGPSPAQIGDTHVNLGYGPLPRRPFPPHVQIEWVGKVE